MTLAIDRSYNATIPRFDWSSPIDTMDDVIAALSVALGAMWTVNRETDCEGEVSIIVLSVIEDAYPVFILYLKNGLPRVGICQDDNWEGDYGFVNIQAAIAEIIVQASEAMIGG